MATDVDTEGNLRAFGDRFILCGFESHRVHGVALPNKVPGVPLHDET